MRSKYKNKIVRYDGFCFRSIRERERYKELKLQERVGAIRDLKLQPIFELQPAFVKNGVKFPSISYQADFSYECGLMDNLIIEDVKGHLTEVFKIKQRLFEAKFPELTIRLVK
jgi:hypothetical protein